MKLRESVCFALLLLSFLSFEVQSSDSDYLPSHTSDGNIGLIELPSARFYEDGEFSFGVSTETPYHRLYSTMQFLPWLQATVRYTEGTHKTYNEGSSQTWKDKGIDFKVRLLEETDFLPSIAIGLTDLGGTGAYSSEYIVSSKRFNQFDFTLGMGWGKLAGAVDCDTCIDNPIGKVFDSFNTRGGRAALGGTLNLGRLFTGPNTSIFYGLEYHTPIPNLSLKLEYDTTNYQEVRGIERNVFKTGDIFELDTRYNLAVAYQRKLSTRDFLALSLGYVHGNTLYANFAIHSNLNQFSKPKFTAPPEILNKPTIKPFNQLNNDWKKYLTELIIWQMGNEGLATHNVIFDGNELKAEISQSRFQDPTYAIELGARILGNNSPTNIDKITIVHIDQGIETVRASIPRSDLVNSVKEGPLDVGLLSFNDFSDPTDNEVIRENEYIYPNFYWSVRPHMQGTLQHQIQFYFWQLEALLHTEYSIRKGLYFSTDIGLNIDNNFEDYKWHIADGKLHHVRQDRRLYLTEGESGIRRMAIDYLVDINKNLKAKLSAGYLEWMYGGVGGEILYVPDSRHWGIGLDLFWVKQRDFDQGFGFQDYENVTGFLSFYYDIPFYDMRLVVNSGKFLGKDVGATIDISRRFETGARVGARVALTDCDSYCVGEGSFNKWIYFDLPMDLFFINRTTRGRSAYQWSPLTKDAGTKVSGGGGTLFNLMTNAQDEIDSLRKNNWSFKKIVSGFGVSPKQKK